MDIHEGVENPRARADRLALGAALIVLGVLLTLDHAGWWPLGGMRQIWPLFLLTLGLGRLLSPQRRGEGVLLVSLAAILLLHTYHVARLHQTWPLLVVLCGVAMLLRAHGADGRGHPRTPSVHVRWHA